MTITEGAILTGGASRRMGRDKAALTLAGKSFADHVAAAMDGVASPVRLVGSRPHGSELELLEDRKPGLGPLSGIHAALTVARAPAVLVVACDLPLVTTAFLSRLVASLSDDDDTVVPRHDGRAVPVCAVYHTRCLARVEARLEARQLSARDFVSSLRTRFIDSEALDPSGTCLLNVNTPEDLERARAVE